MERGYTFVMVDLRGFGGSTGCLDWGGPGEQADVVSAVEWAASQPWSTGKVGMYGKSYDGVTGLIGVNQQPEGSRRSSPRSRSTTSTATSTATASAARTRCSRPALYDAIAATPGPLARRPGLQRNGANDTQRPGCQAANWADQARNDDHYSDYWRARNLIPGARARGAAVPDPGLTENNTVPDGLAQYINEPHRPSAPGSARGTTSAATRPRTAAAEDGPRRLVRRGHALLRPVPEGRQPAVAGPDDRRPDQRRQVARRGAWPPADARGYTTQLRAGQLHRRRHGSVDRHGRRPTRHLDDLAAAALRRAPRGLRARAIVDVATTRPRSNLVVDVYDLDANGTRPADHPPGPPDPRQRRRSTLDLWSTDWKITGRATGSRVRITDANGDWWVRTSRTQQT